MCFLYSKYMNLSFAIHSTDCISVRRIGRDWLKEMKMASLSLFPVCPMAAGTSLKLHGGEVPVIFGSPQATLSPDILPVILR